MLAFYRHFFYLACTKVQGAIVVTLTLALAWVWALASHFTVLHQSFICYGQGTVRRAILYGDRSCVGLLYLYVYKTGFFPF